MFELGGTWQRSRYSGRGQEWDEGRYEHRMERMPDLYGHFSATYSPFDGLELMALGTFSGPMLVYHSVAHDEEKHSHATEVEQVVTPSFFDLTLKAEFGFTLPSTRCRLTAAAGVQNVFNSFQRDFDSGPDRDSSYIYGPTLPRTLFLSLRLEI